MKNRLNLLVVFLIATVSAFSQTGNIKGKISNPDGSPSALASIQIKSTSLGTSSNSNGEFTFTLVPVGKKVVLISSLGIKNVEYSIEVKENETATFNVTLSEQSIELQAVEITGRTEKGYKNAISYSATKTAARLKDVPTTINIVTKELILDQAAYTLNDVVKNISGVNQFSFYNDITIRGFRVQGQRNSGNLTNGMRGFTSFWKQQLIPHIERVEVIKGPSSALFGNASPGGTINRVTKKPLEETRQSITSSVGSFNTLRTLADFTGAMVEDKSLLYRLNVGYESSDGFRDLRH